MSVIAPVGGLDTMANLNFVFAIHPLKYVQFMENAQIANILNFARILGLLVNVEVPPLRIPNVILYPMNVEWG